MKKYLTSLFLLLTLIGGVLAGTPVFSDKAENEMSAMECCKKKQDCDGAKTMSAAMACCLLKCGNPAPTSSSTCFNFSASYINVKDSILKQIALLLKPKKTVQVIGPSFECQTFSPKHQPKYIQHHSFLI